MFDLLKILDAIGDLGESVSLEVSRPDFPDGSLCIHAKVLKNGERYHMCRYYSDRELQDTQIEVLEEFEPGFFRRKFEEEIKKHG